MTKPAVGALVALLAALVAGGRSTSESSERRKPVADRRFSRLPIYFIENWGQFDSPVVYRVPGRDETIDFTPSGITFAFVDRSTEPEIQQASSAFDRRRWVVKLDFVGANPGVRPYGEELTPAIISYFKGPRTKWRRGVPAYRKIRYSNLWPGIDLEFSGSIHRLKYRFLVRPGARPEAIRLAYTGIDSLTLTETKDLAVSTRIGGYQDERPRAYQIVGKKTVEVAASYFLDTERPPGTFTYGLRVGSYDRSHLLILDPAIVVYAGFIGGAGLDSGESIAVDGQGNAYVVGSTDSTEATFPAAAGPDVTFNGGVWPGDAFIVKVNAAGTSILYAGYIGGLGTEFGDGVAVDGTGSAYVTGWTSSAFTFPVIVGPDLTFNGSIYDAFVTKINPSGSDLVYSGFVGGGGSDTAHDIAIDAAGNAYVTGFTGSLTFPVVGPLDPSSSGDDAFVVKVAATGESIVYAGFIGGAALDVGKGIAVGVDGSAYVVGQTGSSETSFPVSVGPDLTFNGGLAPGDGFIAKVDPEGSAMVYAGYIGGTGSDSVNDVAVDAAGNAYVIGSTDSTQDTFPVTVGPDLTFNGGFVAGGGQIAGDAFVAKISPDGSTFRYAGYIGGASIDEGLGIAVDRAGNFFVTGFTLSSEATFPVLGGPDLTSNGASDAFVTNGNAAGSRLLYSGFIGGAGNERGAGIAADRSGAAYVTGETASLDFPVRVGPDLSFNGGNTDAFVAKIAEVAASNIPMLSAGALTLFAIALVGIGCLLAKNHL